MVEGRQPGRGGGERRPGGEHRAEVGAVELEQFLRGAGEVQVQRPCPAGQVLDPVPEQLDGAPGLPRSVLTTRLRSLEHHGIVVHDRQGRYGTYQLTDAGKELAEVCLTLGVWGARWREVLPEHHDPYLVLWSISRLLDPATLPRARVVVRFDLTDRSSSDRSGPERYRLVCDQAGNEVCVHPPGFTEDAVMVTDTGWLTRWHIGAVTLPHAQRAHGITVTGPRWAVQELTRWGRLSPFADIGPGASASG